MALCPARAARQIAWLAVLRGRRLCVAGWAPAQRMAPDFKDVMTQATELNPLLNALGQPIGFALPGWSARPRPPRQAIGGRYCRIEPLDLERHAAQLHAA